MWERAIQDFVGSSYDVWLVIQTWIAVHLLRILIIIIGAEILYRISKRLISKVIQKTTRRHDLFPTELDRKKRIKTLDSLIGATLRIGIFIIATMMIINELGINTGPLIASAGVIGVALGFGAQNLIRDFMSGFFIITENQFRVGDFVEICTTVANLKISGNVEAITIRTTIVRDLDGKLHHIPNGNITVTTNMTMNFAKINEEIIVDQDTDIEKLEHVINHVGQEIAADIEFKQKIIEAPYFARIDRITNDGLVARVYGKVTPGEQWIVKGEIYKKLARAFEKNHIKLANTQVVIHSKR